MAILEIIEAPHPILAKKARPVREDEFGPGLVQFLRDMAETMYAAPGVGLAAPQVADGRRILVADPGFNEDEPVQKRELYSMVNPVIVERRGGTITYEESCLSVPEFVIEVKRTEEVRVSWQTGDGATQEKWFDGFSSVVIQHEMDHLEGVTLLDKASRLKRSRYLQRKKKRSREGRAEFRT